LAAGELVVFNNAYLEDLTGLQSVKSVESGVLIASNTSLKTLDGLHGLEEVGSFLTLVDNPMLEHIRALDRVRVVDHIRVAHNDSLVAIRNPQLEVISGFGALRQVDRDLHIRKITR
jgi:hypothetical protein